MCLLWQMKLLSSGGLNSYGRHLEASAGPQKTHHLWDNTWFCAVNLLPTTVTDLVFFVVLYTDFTTFCCVDSSGQN